jgi:hypothetical protein
MKTHPILLLLLVFGIHLHSFAGGKETQKDFGFAKNSAEISVTPNVSYLIYKKGRYVPFDKPYQSRYPFIGASFGAHYLYRPIQLVAVSTGIDLQLQGLYFDESGPSRVGAITRRTINHNGYLMIPFYLHLFKRMPNSTFEFAVGPEFYFRIFWRESQSSFYADGNRINSSVFMQRDGYQIRDDAALGLSVFLGAQLYLCKQADLFIGPQISILNLIYFGKMNRESFALYGGYYGTTLGLKLGFRLHGAKK